MYMLAFEIQRTELDWLDILLYMGAVLSIKAFGKRLIYFIPFACVYSLYMDIYRQGWSAFVYIPNWSVWLKAYDYI